MPNARVLAFAASLRKGSWNKKLIRVAVEGAREAGAEVTLFNMEEYPLPVYDGDLEAAQGLPENVLKLKDLFKAHNGFLISSPEYNGNIPGPLLNMTNWLSRLREGEKLFEIFESKPAAAMAASPGALGGNRMLPLLRSHLQHMHMLVIPATHGLVKAAEAFDDEGRLKDPKTEAAVKKLGSTVAALAAKLAVA